MKIKLLRLFLIAVSCSVFLSTKDAAASTIFWGTKPNDLLFDSQGNALDATFVFELGTFASTFTPNETNMDQWAANWFVFDAAISGSGWNPAGQEVTGSVEHTTSSGSTSPYATPGATFDQGTTAYLWVYNSKDLNTNPEWALLVDVDNGANLYYPWEFPDPTLENDSFDWQTQDVETAIYGGVNGTRAAGDFSALPATFTIQTAVVPEPGSALLVIIGAMAVIGRAKRRTAARG